MERWREDFHQKGKTSQLYRIWMSVPTFSYRQVLAKIKEKFMIYVVWQALRSMFYNVLVCVSLTNCNLLYHSSILLCLYLDRKTKKS